MRTNTASQGYEVMLIEADDGLGGRVRSDRVEGFTLDRGFQYFSPRTLRHNDTRFTALDLRAFDPELL
jgi:UDP-galactopyranose mutase (EC 5.4.99.9)